MNNELLTSIKNPTLAHFRHFSSLFTNFPSTTVKSPLQISPFLTNKANLPDDQMNVSAIITKEYENIANWKVRKNKPNTKPNKANLLNAQMNVSKVLTKDYENIANYSLAENKPNTKPIQTQSKPISPPHLLINRIKSKFPSFLLKNTADTKNPPKNLMPAPYDLFTNKILAFVAAAGDNKNQISIENFLKSIVNNRRRFRNER